MTWLDSLTIALYTLNTLLVSNAWPPFVYAYNLVTLHLQKWAA